MIRLGELMACVSLFFLGYATGGPIGAVVLPGLAIGTTLTVSAFLEWAFL